MRSRLSVFESPLLDSLTSRGARCRASICRGLIVVAAFVAVGCAGCPQEKGLTDTSDFPPDRLFRLHCSQCHGDGSGNGHRVTALKAKPKDMTRSEWQRSVTDEHLLRVISEGGPAAKLHQDMPSWKLTLSRRQMKELVQYIRTFDDTSSAGQVR